MATIHEGFSAYEEIDGLARRAFPGRKVETAAAIVGNDYHINVDGTRIASGTSQEVRKRLNQVLTLLDKPLQ